MKKKLLIFILVAAFVPRMYGQAQRAGAGSEEIVSFRFVPGNDMFYIPWGGNDVELNRLYALVDEFRADITNGTIPVYVDGYCASLPTTKENLNTAFVRANRVKSELITHKALSEDHFITKNYATSYEDRKDVVVVTLRIPAKAVEADFEPQPEHRSEAKPEPEPVVEVKPEPQPEPVVVSDPVDPWRDPYGLAVRTNLLYDVFLLPTLGVEWRVNRHVGIKVDGSISHWGGEHGKVQKVWAVSPEVRWYLGDAKLFYVGAGGNYADCNIYKYMVGGILSSDTGYQGDVWSVGVTTGYQLCLSNMFSLDFNVGLGYIRAEYDTFGMINGVRVYKAKDRTKNRIAPTQAGVSLVWKLGR